MGFGPMAMVNLGLFCVISAILLGMPRKYIAIMAVVTAGVGIAALVARYKELRRSPKVAPNRPSEPQTKIGPDEIPTTLVIGIDGRFELDQVLSVARQHQKELVVMGNRSPAFANPNVRLQESAKFHHDPTLVLIFEKNVPPLSGDPMVIVRRSFLLEAGSRLQAKTLGQFAILMTMEATKKNLKVEYL